MSVYLWYIGALVVTLIFPPAAIVVFGFAILNHWGINEGEKEKLRKELKQHDSDRTDYEHEKWKNPLASKTKIKIKSLDNTIAGAFMPKHDDFLIAQIKQVESAFREYGADLFITDPNGKLSASIDSAKLGSNADKISYQLIPTPAKYIKLCDSVSRKPMPELLELWEAAITQGNWAQAALEKIKDQRLENEEKFARELRAMIITRLSSGEDWQPILADSRAKISHSEHSSLRVWREHGDWIIKAHRTVSQTPFQLRF